jgi:hypothetical protein
MARVGPGADIAGAYRRGNAEVAGAAPAADRLRPAVPGSLDAACSAVHGVEREANPDVDVLVGVLAVEQVDLAE